ncbi:nuclear cap-binding protein subunit 3-like [Pieris brassicae]|uniref:Nuclear cap-binding protein subunit 3 n=1 Tax=Pieris brassicae TaxID=7116 RepID=A0A9P0TDW3_PIEBR|nr:nuclear cap-binding protein subunit 3-like [Pieris brassicae]CAH4029643.1 unnamed protein product [Pieris brassicae]
MDFDKEDGEMSDDYEMDIEERDQKPDIQSEDSTLLYRADKTGPIIKQLAKIDSIKFEERAKRFGLNLSGNRIVTQKQIDELYANIGIEENERHYRLDTLHITGIDGLTTKDVFEYLEDYKPVSLEWVDSTSCNMVCQDHIAAALALLVHSHEISDDSLKEMLSERSTYHWREGMPHPKRDVILMRFATNADKKMAKRSHDSVHPRQKKHIDLNDKNPWGDLCMSWGVYDHQEVFQRKLPHTPDYNDDDVEPRKIIKPRNKNLAMRLGNRNQVTQLDESSDSDAEWNKKSKVPRMRMRADDEESKIKKIIPMEQNNLSDKEEYAPLSIEVLNSRNSIANRSSSSHVLSDMFKKAHRSKNIQSRLGVKVVPNDQCYSDSCSDSDFDSYNTMSKVQKVDNRNKESTTVWSRLDRQFEQSINKTDLRQIIKTKKHSKSDDLRERLGKPKSNLRIEIDNNYAK